MLMDFIPCFFLSSFRIIWLSFLERKEQSNTYVCIIFQFALFAYLHISAYLFQCIFLILWVLYTVRYVTDRKSKIVKLIEMLMTYYDEIWINRYLFFVRTFTGYCKDYLLYKGLVTEQLLQRTKWRLLRRNFLHIKCFIK